MQQEKNKKTEFVLSLIFTPFLTIICFLILGTFYKAVEHSIALNVIIWCFTILTAYSIYWSVVCLICYKKKTIYPKFFNGWALLSGLLIITIICLIMSFEMDDYLFVEFMGGFLAYTHFFK